MNHLVSGPWPLLEFLELATNDLQPSDFGLVNKAHWPLVKVLDFSNNGGSASEAPRPHASCGMSDKIRQQLQVLDLQNCNFGLAEVASVCQGRYPQLTLLNLSANQMCEQAMKVLMASPWPNLHFLNLSWSDVDDVGIGHLVQGHSKLPNLEFLDLVGNLLTVQALEVLLKANWPNLAHLMLNRNRLGTGPIVLVNGHVLVLTDDDTIVPQWIRQQWPRLTTLAVQGCNIDFDV